MENFNFNFNVENFGLGVLAGWATAYGVYRARHILGAARASVTEQVSGAQDYATRSADSRYLGDLIKHAEAAHLIGQRVALSEILVEPRFIAQPDFVQPPDDDVVHSVFHVVPIIPDHPYLHAPYNVTSLSIEDLSYGSNTIALLGLPGSGRTTALHAIALWSLGRVTFTPPVDPVQERLEEEDEELNDEDRSKRIKERMQIEEMALSSLERGREANDNRPTMREAKSFKQLTPLYLHIGNIDLSEYGRQIDPAEPLVRAIQHEVGRITSQTIPGNIYTRLEDGDALVLIDGFDDLPMESRHENLMWLRGFIEAYSNNVIIVTGPTQGYNGLVEAGLTPVFLRPWTDINYDTLADKWATAWGKITQQRRGADVPQAIIEDAKSANRTLSAFDVSLKLWAYYNERDDLPYEGQIRQIIDLYLPSKIALGTILPKLVQAAVLQLDNGFINAETLYMARNGNLASATPFKDSDDDIDSLLDEQGSTPEPQNDSQAKRDIKELDKFLKDLHKSGLLMRFRNGQYRFQHSMLAAYFASLSLAELDDDALLERADDPNWQTALMMTATHTDLEPIIRTYLNADLDILQNHLLDVTRWIAYDESRAEWKVDVLKTLGNAFVAPQQYPLVRERLAAAMAGMRQPNARAIFEKSLRHPNADVRRLACLALGAMRMEKSIGALIELLDDPAPDVQLAAGLALGGIGTQDALEAMVIAFTETDTGSDQLRQALAEAFATIPDEGYPILYDAIQHQNMKLRRAAVFGLRRISTPWALIALYRVSLEDAEWYVRTAAEQTFYDMQYNEVSGGARAYPQVENIPWLRDWVNSLGENAIEENQTPEDLLLLALQDDDPIMQEMVIISIGQLGLMNFTETLYSALRHRDKSIREAAHRALGNLQYRMGQPLPSPA